MEALSRSGVPVSAVDNMFGVELLRQLQQVALVVAPAIYAGR
jgi:hypothetical protein